MLASSVNNMATPAVAFLPPLHSPRPSPILFPPHSQISPSRPRHRCRPPVSRIHSPPPPQKDPRQDQWSPENLGFQHIATITTAHGVRGEVKARAVGDFDAFRLGPGVHTSARYLLLPGRRYPRPVHILSGRPASQPNQWILRLEGLISPEQVRNLQGARLYVTNTDRPQLARGEYMLQDLVYSRVTLLLSNPNPSQVWYATHGRRSGLMQAGPPIGVVDSVITGHDICKASGAGPSAAAVASDMLQIATFDMSDNSNMNTPFCHQIPDHATRILIPFVKQIVPIVDIQHSVLVLDPPPGLLSIAVVNSKQKPRPPRALLMPAAN